MEFLAQVFVATGSTLYGFVNEVAVGLRDIVDVVFITLLIYGSIAFFKRAHLTPVFVGILIIFILYGAAVFFDLPLTLFTLRSFFGVFVIILAVVFQRELRRLFSLIGFVGLRVPIRPHYETDTEVLVRTVFALQERREGALIVLAGKESLDDLLRGGIELHGMLSRPLLMSIFDPSSPGHDGGVIVVDNRVERFGAHLPLAEQFSKARDYGLRHRAAVGLTEQSDALVIVVSEERGTVSVAEGGELRLVQDEAKLAHILTEFYKNVSPHQRRLHPSMRALVNGGYLLLSLAVASGLWLAAGSGSRLALSQRNITVVPEFVNIPTGYVLQSIMPADVVLTLEGRSTEFSLLSAGDVRIVVDLSKVQETGIQEVGLAAADIRLPRFSASVSVIKIDPPRIRVNLATTTLDIEGELLEP